MNRALNIFIFTAEKYVIVLSFWEVFDVSKEHVLQTGEIYGLREAYIP